MDGIEPGALRGPFFCAALGAIRAGRRTRRAQGAEHDRDRPASGGAGYASDRPASGGADIYKYILASGGADMQATDRLAGAQTGALESRGLDV